MAHKHLQFLAAIGLATATSLSFGAVTVDGVRNGAENYVVNVSGDGDNTFFGFGDSAKVENIQAQGDASRLYVFLEGSIHSSNKVFLLIDSDASNATGFSGGHPNGTYGESDALEYFTDFPDGGYDLMVELTGNGNPATNFDVVVFTYDTAGALAQEQYIGNLGTLVGSLNATVRSNLGSLQIGFVTGDAAGNGIELGIPRNWLLGNTGQIRLVSLNGNSGNNFWSDSVVPSLAAGGNIGFTPGPNQGLLTALVAPVWNWSSLPVSVSAFEIE